MERDSRKIEEAVKVAETPKLKLQVKQVRSPSEIPDALEAIANQVDVVWDIPDDVRCIPPRPPSTFCCFRFEARFPWLARRMRG